MTTKTRTEHIADLTRQIEAGTYHVDAEQIVDGMMAKTWGELNPTEQALVTRSLQLHNRAARNRIYRAKAEELRRNEAAQSTAHCPVHNVLYTVRTGNRYDDCLRCARWKAEHFVQESGMVPAPPPDPSDNTYGGGWSVYQGRVTAFDWVCVLTALFGFALIGYFLLK